MSPENCDKERQDCAQPKYGMMPFFEPTVLNFMHLCSILSHFGHADPAARLVSASLSHRGIRGAVLVQVFQRAEVCGLEFRFRLADGTDYVCWHSDVALRSYRG